MHHKLLDAAQEIVQMNGFNAFSYARLSKSVGIKTASIHYHFPSKDDLGEALLRRYRERFNALLHRIDAENPGAPDRIERYVDQFLKVLDKGGKICLFGMFASDYNTLPENMRKHIRGFFADNEAWLEMVLKQGKADCSFTLEADAKDLAVALFSTIEGAMLGARMFEDKGRLQRTIGCWLSTLVKK